MLQFLKELNTYHYPFPRPADQESDSEDELIGQGDNLDLCDGEANIEDSSADS
jgi:hypothetical protein